MPMNYIIYNINNYDKDTLLSFFNKIPKSKLIQIGLNTQTHDQLITLHNLSITKTIVNTPGVLIVKYVLPFSFIALTSFNNFYSYET